MIGEFVLLVFCFILDDVLKLGLSSYLNLPCTALLLPFSEGPCLKNKYFSKDANVEIDHKVQFLKIEIKGHENLTCIVH